MANVNNDIDNLQLEIRRIHFILYNFVEAYKIHNTCKVNIDNAFRNLWTNYFQIINSNDQIKSCFSSCSSAIKRKYYVLYTIENAIDFKNLVTNAKNSVSNLMSLNNPAMDDLKNICEILDDICVSIDQLVNRLKFHNELSVKYEERLFKLFGLSKSMFWSVIGEHFKSFRGFTINTDKYQHFDMIERPGPTYEFPRVFPESSFMWVFKNSSGQETLAHFSLKDFKLMCDDIKP